ncbi:HTTM domain-containing protein [Haliangium sp.]|uniref:HTTM domain-containing protein n=1 Tax=Haliangium sp. TaxID=2663208 RepID=UPI003D132303
MTALARWARALWSRPRRWWRAWVALLSRREPATGLACFRLAVGLVALYSLLSVGLSGLVGVLWIDAAHGGYKPLGAGNWLLSLLGGPQPDTVYPLYGLALALTLAFTAGVGGRVAGRIIAFATLHVYLALVMINSEATGGYDLLISNAMWLCVLGDATAALSLRCRLGTGRWIPPTSIPAWPRYLALFQLLLMYTSTGLHKLTADWTPAGGYSALFRVYQDPTWRRFDMDWTAWVYPLTQIATALTWCFEVSALLLLLVLYFRATADRPGRLRRLCNRRDLRLGFAAMGLCLHLGILVTFNVGPFSWITLAYYLCLWHPDELARAGARARALVKARPSG